MRLSHDLSKEDECRLLNGSIRYVFSAPEALNDHRSMEICTDDTPASTNLLYSVMKLTVLNSGVVV